MRYRFKEAMEVLGFTKLYAKRAIDVTISVLPG
jgi:hypothetical protein